MKIAILIDLDNIKNETSISRIFSEIPHYGDVVFKYGFYSIFDDKKIKVLLQRYGIVPIMYPSFVGGKSCSDIGLTIKAMDLMNNPNIDCFAIASNDSDFISLSSRIKEENKKTILITDTQNIDKNKYNYFDIGIDIYDMINSKQDNVGDLVSDKEISILSGEKDEKKEDNASTITQGNLLSSSAIDNQMNISFSDETPEIIELLARIETAFNNIATDNDYARLSNLIVFLNKNGKKFDPKTYGHSNKRPKDFFEKRLSKYFLLDNKDKDVFIKFKPAVVK